MGTTFVPHYAAIIVVCNTQDGSLFEWCAPCPGDSRATWARLVQQPSVGQSPGEQLTVGLAAYPNQSPSAAPPRRRPFVSIVVPCRNEAAYIRPLLDSILANDYPRDRLEVLVVDGMSDDGTRDVIARYAREHPAIQLLDNPKRTTPHALNLGITRARGAIIMRMDAHASFPSTSVADVVDWLERTGADYVGGAWVTLPGDTTAMARAIAA